MKTKEELNAIKKEVETLNKKLAELTDEELAEVSGGGLLVPCPIRRAIEMPVVEAIRPQQMRDPSYVSECPDL